MNDNQIPPAGEPVGAALQHPAGPPERILVVDDDPDARRLVTEALVAAGYGVDSAKDGAHAWGTLQYNTYDLLITDNSMPKMTGIELLKSLRAARMVLPVIMATGILPTHEFAQSPWLIPDATLVRPFTMDELLRKVRTVLSASDSPRAQINPTPNQES